MEIGQNKAQAVLKTCDSHAHRELSLYCRSCKKTICSLCAKEKHLKHVWETLTEFLKEKRTILPEKCRAIENVELPLLRKEKSNFDVLIEKVNQNVNKDTTALNAVREKMVNSVNMFVDEKIASCKGFTEEVLESLRKERSELSSKIEYLDNMCTSLGKKTSSYGDHDILEMEREMLLELKKALSYKSDVQDAMTSFTPGYMDLQKINDMIGEVHGYCLQMRKKLKKFDKSIVSMEPADRDKAWVLPRFGNEICLLETDGQIQERIAHDMTNFIITNDGTILLTQFQEQVIKEINTDGVEINGLSTKPIYPTCLSKADNNEILVSLRDNGDPFTLLTSSRRIVRRMKLNGAVIHTYEFTKNGKTRLFTLPQRLAANKNGDICVTNFFKQISGEIVVLRANGDVRIRYRGQEGQGFCPYDVKCSSLSCIIVAEAHSQSLFILNEDCTLVHRISPGLDAVPYTIALYEDTLWMGNHDGSVAVFSFSCQ